ncbi:SAM-dependent methyltransferase [uncultured Tateyamaria sp.]|uniref:class I SAM-dependent methyltransferase n=1 Tax=Tateyamaria sp. 1078 TaxID=3417464 RepID=UPI002625BBD3|nr:SAM-dependent methyltransferase [uncultured Tateyamaria sp.]
MSLKARLLDRIATGGPLTVADYMAEALLNPEYGYYTTRTPFGTKGDFITAPEMSQMFGEVIGLCLAQSWMDQGAPSTFTLAELGPGRGTLMADALRATARVPGFLAAAQIVLVEVSPTLRDRQAETLEGYEVTWIDSAADLPDGPLWCVANEFFDALPIRQFIRDGKSWRERCVGVQQDMLGFGLAPQGPQPRLDNRLADTADGDLVETCPAADAILSELAQRIDTHGGIGLIIDYGDWRSLGDTLQAVRDHQPVGVLDAPGTADLTAHVDFEALAASAAPAAHTRLTPQGVFLERLGITQRAQALAGTLEGEALKLHIAAHRRLTHPDEMGNLFKVLGLYPATAAPPPGLSA